MQASHPPHICVAPMLDWTDRHCRYFLRLFSPYIRLYTEMVTTGALLYAQDSQRFLTFSAAEQPVALQLGGSDPHALALCAQRAQAAGFAEVNLNLGCPSARVQNGRFGACLIAEPALVADCIQAMRSTCQLPITIKTRIGIDQQNDYAQFQQFVDTVSQAGCDTIIVHARNAWLQGLSPKQNRNVPPLRYDWVYRLKQDMPKLTIIINGGITTVAAAIEHCQHVDGVMIGRESYHNPYYLARLSQHFYQTAIPEPVDIIQRYMPYVIQQLQQDVSLATLTKPIFGLFHQRPGARAWRRYLSEQAHMAGATEQVILQALAATAGLNSEKAIDAQVSL